MGALKTKDDIIIVEAVHESKNEDGSSNSRKFTKEFKMPAGVVTEQLASTYSGAGILTVSAPRQIQAPEGAEVSEAMKAQSQAFVTEDGTAVKKDELALNMQQYSPDDITIKLNGRTLTIEAAGHGEQFKQKHVIPNNIDLDAMSSSFSS